MGSVPEGGLPTGATGATSSTRFRLDTNGSPKRECEQECVAGLCNFAPIENKSKRWKAQLTLVLRDKEQQHHGLERSMSPASARHLVAPKRRASSLDNKLHWMKAFPF